MLTPITVEIGTTRSLQLVGRDMAAAAIAARNQGTVTDVLMDRAVIAAVTGPVGPLAAALAEVDKAKADGFAPDGTARRHLITALSELAETVRVHLS